MAKKVKNQLSFLSEADATPQLAPVSSQTSSLAASLPASLRMGTMSWNYPGWIGPFYDRHTREQDLAGQGLRAYAQHPLLRAVEIDRSHYQPITTEMFASFAAQVPQDFRFVVKAHQECTIARFPKHARYGKQQGQVNAHFLDATYAADVVVAPAWRGLEENLGAIVFQFPAQSVKDPRAFATKLGAFLRALPRGPLYAVELRNDELLTDAYADALVAAGAVHSHNVWGDMPSVLAQAARLPPATRKNLLVRWVSRPGESYEAATARMEPFDAIVDADDERLRDVATLFRQHGLDDALIVLNNKAEGCAPQTIERLARLIAILEA